MANAEGGKGGALEGAGSGSGSRQRRRQRDREKGGSEKGFEKGGSLPVGPLPHYSLEAAQHKGGQNGFAAKVDSSIKVEINGKGGSRHYGEYDGHFDGRFNGHYDGRFDGRFDGRNGHNGYGRGRGYGEDGRGRGYGEGKGNRGYRGGREHQRDFMPATAPWSTPEEHSLKDLLMQVAPQARIAENTSRLSSKASANILSKVLTEAANNSSQEPAFCVHASGSSSAHGVAVQPGFGAPFSDGGAGQVVQQALEEDDESAFMEKWSGLFSKGSPLVDGSLEDPFEDWKKRGKVVWKNKGDRAGHRRRYQERKAQREKDEAVASGYYHEDGATIMYDASAPDGAYYGANGDADAMQAQWRPQRPPSGT